MATKLENLALEIAHLDHFKHHLPGYSLCCNTTLHWLVNLGGVQVSTLFEQAIANLGGFEVVSTDAADISDGSDAKLSSVRTSSNGRSYSAPVTNTKNKTGLLRVQVFERKQHKFYYFVIPHSAYRDVPATSNIEIPFELDGTPRRKNRCAVNWWAYEVGRFETMCKSKRARKKS